MNNDNKFADVYWTWQDVARHAPNFSKEDCENFLDLHSDSIRDAMIAKGWDIIWTKLLEENDA